MNVYYLAMNGAESDTPLATKVLRVLDNIKENPNLFLIEAFKLDNCDDVIDLILNNYKSLPEITINVIEETLEYAVKNSDLLLVQNLIEVHGANVQNALELAAAEANVILVRYLIQKQGADPLANPLYDKNAITILVKAFNNLTHGIVYSDQAGPISSLEAVRDIYKSAHEERACKALDILYLVRDILNSIDEDAVRAEVSSALLTIAVQNGLEAAFFDIGKTPLRVPVNEFFEMVNLLLEFGGDINAALGGQQLCKMQLFLVEDKWLLIF